MIAMRYLLRGRGLWPHRRRAAEKSYELAPPHARPQDQETHHSDETDYFDRGRTGIAVGRARCTGQKGDVRSRCAPPAACPLWD
jgi:hypothetical protein